MLDVACYMKDDLVFLRRDLHSFLYVECYMTYGRRHVQEPSGTLVRTFNAKLREPSIGAARTFA